ncbi:hypothetical protein Y1Q_0017970 [Alligator mississippiensis]|uniref:Uncharacterized protein n=1 Tax=Alligator mississippiensis TaxID=8496 RepID=A0A151MY32_ALLMI|nr:hypothetical protein Y1Q_0017970 [Alligator mississippiensis]
MLDVVSEAARWMGLHLNVAKCTSLHIDSRQKSCIPDSTLTIQDQIPLLSCLFLFSLFTMEQNPRHQCVSPSSFPNSTVSCICGGRLREYCLQESIVNKDWKTWP